MPKPVKQRKTAAPALRHFLNSTTILNGRVIAGLAAFASSVAMIGVANAAPAGGTVTKGAATICVGGDPTCHGMGHNNSSETLIHQTSQRAIINWSSFDTGSTQTVTFQQPGSTSITLNRISGAATSFKGTLNANGQVILVNNNGFILNGAHITARGLVLSTADVSDDDGFCGTHVNCDNGSSTVNFDHASPNHTALIEVKSSVIHTAPGDTGGYALVLAPSINIRTGTTIQTPGGTVGLGAGEKFTMNIDPAGDGLINFAVTDPVTVHSLAHAINIENGVTLDAEDFSTGQGQVIITADVIDGVYNQSTAINFGNPGTPNYDGPNTGKNILIRPCPIINGVASCVTINVHPAPAPDSAPDSHVDSAPDTHVDSAPDSHVDSAPDTHVDSAPDSHVDSAPDTHVDSAPDSHVDSAPDTHVDSAPDTHVDSAPDSHVDSAPDTHVDSAPDSHVDSAPDTHVDSAPDSHVDSAPDTHVDSAPDSHVDSAPDSTGDSPAPAPFVEPNPCFENEDCSPSPAPPTPTPAPVVDFQGTNFTPLDRPFLSLRDDEVLNTPNKNGNFSFFQPIFTNRGSLDLSIFGGAGGTPPGNLTPGQLANLSPASGVNEDDENGRKKAKQLGQLAPSAGGLGGTTTVNVAPANNLLDQGWKP